jgi:hypothetical protein
MLGSAVLRAGVPFRLDAGGPAAGDHFTFATDAGPIDRLGTPAGTDGSADLAPAATDEDLDRFVVRVASLDDLIRMKRAADRLQDRIALEWLSALRDELELTGALVVDAQAGRGACRGTLHADRRAADAGRCAPRDARMASRYERRARFR